MKKKITSSVPKGSVSSVFQPVYGKLDGDAGKVVNVHPNRTFMSNSGNGAALLFVSLHSCLKALPSIFPRAVTVSIKYSSNFYIAVILCGCIVSNKDAIICTHALIVSSLKVMCRYFSHSNYVYIFAADCTLLQVLKCYVISHPKPLLYPPNHSFSL